MKNSPVFLDTNVILRHVLQDDQTHSPLAAHFIQSIETKDVTVRVTDTVIFETVFTLEKTYRVPRNEIASAILPLIGLTNVELPGKASYVDVFGLWIEHQNLSFADCFHAVAALRTCNDVVISFDRGYDRIPHIVRREPKTD